MRKIVFELCAETLDACRAAGEGGAARLEICSALSEGGITPSHGLIAQAVKHSGLPVHVLIRPRGGYFVYTADEFALMRADIHHARDLGAAGVVLGLLAPNNEVDATRTAQLVAFARPMEVTFHRAFDATPALEQALETVIALGCERVLTSGGERDIVAGASTLQLLCQQAQGRIAVAAGGGLRLETAARVARETGLQHFHGSLQRKEVSGRPAVTAEAIRTMIQRLEQG